MTDAGVILILLLDDFHAALPSNKGLLLKSGTEWNMGWNMEWIMEIGNRHTEQGTEIHCVPIIQHMAIIGTEMWVRRNTGTHQNTGKH